jgi:hypothetical protein
MGASQPPKHPAIPPAKGGEGVRLTAEAFAALTRKKMLAELKRLGIARGKSKARKAELEAFYREHCGAAAKSPSVTEHIPATTTLSPTILIKTLPPPEQRELERLAEPEHEPATTTLSPDVVVETLPPAERREVEAAVEAERRDNPPAQISIEMGRDSETHFFADASSGDVADGGIFVATKTLLPIGTSVILELGAPDGVAIVAEGDVAWIGDAKDGMGIRFTRVDDVATAAIRAHMTSSESR